MEHIKRRKKLIEVALPLDAINAASAREKSIRHGHPSTLHLWWARRPLAACRAVIFASLVDDPGDCADEFPSEDAQRAERQRLHDLIRRIVVWENSNDVNLLAEARYEIARSVARGKGETAPTEPAAVLAYLNRQAQPIYDPFAGGGSIPLEAQRLGLRAIGSDLNPVAVLINKAMIEIPSQFAGKPPVNPDADPLGLTVGKGKRAAQVPWRGAAGLADDVRYYGRKMREMAWERIGHLYPKAKLDRPMRANSNTVRMGSPICGGEATVIAWLWARTVPCPNPACGVAMPLMTTFQVSKKKDKEHWMRPVVESENRQVSFVMQDSPQDVPERTVIRGGKGAVCLACTEAVTHAYIRQQSTAGNMGAVMTCVVAEGDRKRLFLSPSAEQMRVAFSGKPNKSSIPWQKMPTTAYLVSGRGYGITHWHQLFTDRQLVALTTFSDLLPDIRARIVQDGADEAYASAVSTYLALAVGRTANGWSSYNLWQNLGDFVAQVFVRQAISIVWDFAEANPFSSSTQNWLGQIEWVSKVLDYLPRDVNAGASYQADAATTIHADKAPVIVTGPPYYDNIGYADLSDFFYVWLRPLLRDIYPDLFAGIMTPKQEEMIAAPRFDNAKERFEALLGQTLRRLHARCSPEFPSSIFYAYKQQEEERDGVTSTGWETMLTALVNAGFQIVGTWPIRTESTSRLNAQAANALASSVVLVCRPRPSDTPLATRREFVDALKEELPAALRSMQAGSIAPVDLAQAAIGPGMAIYSRFARVLDVSGRALTVRAALALINQTLDEMLAEQEGDFDADTRFAVAWFEQAGFEADEFGVAETLITAKNTSDAGLIEAGIVESGSGKMRLLRPHELPDDWDPETDTRRTVWEMVHHLIRVHDQSGEQGAAELLAKLGADAESARELAYRLYRICEGKQRAQEALGYNALVQSWPEIARLAQERPQVEQATLLDRAGTTQ